MIDFHNHVLPNVDDGPKTIKESILMLQSAKEQGIKAIVNTVHFQHPKMEGKNTDQDFLYNKVKELTIEAKENDINIKIHLGYEVFYLPNLVEILNNPLATLGNNKYMLVEFHNNIYPTGYEEEFYNLQLNGVTPIIAHPERYTFIQNDIDILAKWKDRGYIIQIDGGSIIGKFGKRTQIIAEQIVKNNLFDIIGSDAHNSKKRNFCLKDSYKKIEQFKNADYIMMLKNNLDKILNGEDVLNEEYSKINKSRINKFFSKIFKQNEDI
tara:strand:- start:1249 stop:2049 length:801 start_codon:yes stop_codon:yes gene_type:complete